MKLSVVVPCFNEEKNLLTLLAEIETAVRPLSISYEIIFVNDGSTDNTQSLLDQISQEKSNVRIVHLLQNSGQSFATMRGFEKAEGELIALLDADLQNDAADIPRMLNLISEEIEAVCGWRRQRKDTTIFVVSSRVANAIIRFMFGSSVHDSGCSLRVVKASYLKQIRYFKNFHRYIPIILHQKGVILTELEVNHRWRKEGQSNYSIFKSLRVIKELIYLRFFY